LEVARLRLWIRKESVAAIFSLGLIGVVVLMTPARAGDAKAEIDFVTRASIGNLFAITESQLAIDRTNDPEVKAFAEQLVADHEKASAALVSAADQSGATVSTTLDGDHQARVTTLQGKSGPDFDQTYIADQGEIHSNTLTLYADYMLLGDNTRLKALAIKMIPITEAQLKKAQALSGN
jgi:putative membrane protein